MEINSSITGTIYDTFNTPLVGVKVYAYDKDLRSEQLLNEAVTDEKGHYTIRYDGNYSRAENKTSDIFLRVFANNGVVLGESSVNFNAPSDFTLDFKLGNSPYKGPSEFDSLVNSIKPLLEFQRVTMTDLKEDEKFHDISFLAQETGEAFEKISYIPIAFSYSGKTKTPPDIFYAFFRVGLPVDLNQLLLVKSESLLKGLKMAINENIISSKWEKLLDSIIKDLNSIATNFVLKPDEEQNAGFKMILQSALPDAELQKVFVNTFFENESAPEKFWSVLKTQNGFTDGRAIEEIKTVLSINQLTDHQPALTSLLYSESKQDPELKELRGFSKFTKDDWKAKISGLVSRGELKDFPIGIEGADAQEKNLNYSNAISDIIQQAFPTSVFSSRLNSDASGSFGDRKPDLQTFFRNNPDFDLKSNKINALFEKAKLDGVNNKEALKVELKNINRLYKLSPVYEHVKALKELGLGSSSAIVQQYSAEQLVQKLQPMNVSREEAMTIYHKAIDLDKKSTALVLAYKTRHDVPIYAITGTQSLDGNYQSMFKDNYLCDCDHCQSVYSPSAYLVDILHFLQKNNNGDAFNKLVDRRPDLIKILLTCENTNTPLPYIDLVNELLESIIENQTTIAYQTESTAAELAAFPQNILPAAYDKLKNSPVDYKLPFDLPLETSGKLLDKLGLKRQVILEMFHAKGPQSVYTDAEIAKEVLGLSTGDVDVLRGAIQMTGLTGGSQMETVLKESQLSYMELLQVLESNFVNPLKPDNSRSLQIISSSPDEPTTCDISKLTLSGIDITILLKLIRFVRLQQKLDLTVFDLDRILRAFNINSFDAASQELFYTTILIPITNVIRLKNRFGISVEKALTLYANIDTTTYLDHSNDNGPVPSLYDQLFRNKAVSNPIDEGFTPQAIGLAGAMADHLPALLSAFNTSPADFALLLAGNGIFAPVSNDLTLQNLSELYRRALFASLSKLTIQDFFDAVTILGINPFQGSTWTDLPFVFSDDLDFIRSGAINLRELNYLLADKETNPGISPSIEFIAGILDPVRAGLKKISNETGLADLTSDAATRSVAEAFIIDRLSSTFKTDHATTKTILNETVKFSGDPSKSFLEALLSSTFFNSTGPLFTLDDFKKPIPSLPDYFNSYLHAYKIVFLIKKLKLSADEILYFTNNASALSIGPLLNNTVPIPFDAFENLSAIIKLRNNSNIPSAHLLDILSIPIKNEANAKNNFILALSDATSASPGSLLYLLGNPADQNDKGKLNFDFPAAYLNGNNMLQLISCIGLAKGVGVDLGGFMAAVNTNDSNFLSGLLKSRYTETEWLNIIQPISNQLRTRKRDALVAYLLNDSSLAGYRTSGSITDTSSLYEHLMIDVEMEACMYTSRIKQAISSVQLFVDRCLMNLEEGALLDTSFSKQWNSWRKQYRVWEANRKIFLYPENWIAPELRDDKSPFFKELESKLRQSEVTDNVAQDVVYNYLEKLDTVADLESIGIFYDELTEILHVFGRTKGIPHQYFYRYQQKSVWSPWEKVEVDVEGDYILPVVYNNRLMLFWAILTEKQEANPNGVVINPGVPIPPPDFYYEVKIAWSEYKNGKWASKKMSKEFIQTPVNTVINKFQFESAIVEGKLLIKMFFWLDFFLNNTGLGIFIFDGCNSSPSVRQIGFQDTLNQTFYPIPDVRTDLMFFQELPNSDQKFQLYDTGFFSLGSSHALNDIFLSTPAKATLLFNHHEIERNRPDKFFYRAQDDNFYGQSVSIFRPPVLDEELVNNSGMLIARKQVDPKVIIFNSDIKSISAVAVLPGRVPVGAISDSGLVGVPDKPKPFVFFWGKRYWFQTFKHPYVCSFIKTFNTEGMDGLYKEDIQTILDKVLFTSAVYNPTNRVRQPFPVEKLDFDFSGVYANYNWEIFFHIPLLMATRLSQNQKFEEAREWFHYIFNPTKSSSDPNEGAERFWITKPFKEEVLTGIMSIEQLLDEDQNPDLQKQLDYWAENPFNPHAVARLRLSAYMRTTVMKYIDNLIAWGDNLFQRDTIESINEATLLYILAGNILGKRPEKVSARAIPAKRSYSDIQNSLDGFSNAKVEIETFISPSSDGTSSDSSVLMPMFCIPKNDQLLAYWDTVDDRLFKIRNCMNIEGVVRQLALFEPALDPGLLLRAKALGLDLNSIMNEVSPALPPYRFQFMIQKANELSNDVKSLGNALLSALEKGDVEQLASIHSLQEVSLLESIREVKLSQVEEASQNLEAVNSSRQVIEEKMNYYGGKPYTNASEQAYFDSLASAQNYFKLQEGSSTLASVLHLIPDIKAGAWSWGFTTGGSYYGLAASAAAAVSGHLASTKNADAAKSLTKGGYDQRKDDWQFQTKTADLELKQMDRQIAAAEIRLAICEKELENHDRQIQNAKEVDDFLRDKFTNSDLYEYMVGQISSIYFQTYQMAYTIAKKAEKCMQQELGLEDTTYIQFGYWDSLKKGLLSGDKLQYDLRRLENAYLEQNQREFEITKNISLATLNAKAILDLRQNGTCTFQLPELLFEMDFPGHYFRRVRSIGVSIPCIAGPYTSVSSQLTLNRSYIRMKDDNGGLAFDFSNPSSDYKVGSSAVKAIATSHGQGDAGMFDFNFRDERYLPFEGAGVISEWNLELPTEARQFDYNSISDIIITVRYTSRDSKKAEFKTAVNTKIREAMAAAVDLLNSNGGLFKLVSLKNDFPDVFYQMKSDNSTTSVSRDLSINKSFFPYFTNTYETIFKACSFFNKDGSPVTFAISAGNLSQETIDNNWKLGLHYTPADLTGLDDVYILINYSLG